MPLDLHALAGSVADESSLIRFMEGLAADRQGEVGKGGRTFGDVAQWLGEQYHGGISVYDGVWG